MQSLVFPVMLFTLSMTITPGPNNMLLTASGARFGYRRTFPLIVGIVIGIISQLLLSVLGLGILFQSYPILQKGLKIAGCAYILYLSVKIAFSSKQGTQKDMEDKPLSLLQGAALQYLNPKAYLMTITAMSVYPLEGDLFIPSAVFILFSFLIICPLSISVWAGFGALLNKAMAQKNTGPLINRILGGITAVSVVFILI